MYVNNDPCEICKSPNATTIEDMSGIDGIHQKCPRCGEFKVTGTATSMLRRLDTKQRAKLSGWVYEQYLAGASPMITSDNLPKLLARPLPSVTERANALLIEAERDRKSVV